MYKVKKVYKNKKGFCPRRIITCNVSVSPIDPIPVEHDILRCRDTEELICLEQDGLLEATLKFEISNRKELGIKSQSRQLSTLYKVEMESVRNVLAAYNEPPPPNSVQAKLPYLQTFDVSQTYVGVLNGKKLEVTLDYNKLGAAAKDPILFTKYITVLFMLEGVKQNMFKRTYAVLDPDRVNDNIGLFVIDNIQSLFNPSRGASTVPITQALGVKNLGFGRRRATLTNPSGAAGAGGSTASTTGTGTGSVSPPVIPQLTPFDTLPVAFSILEADPKDTMQYGSSAVPVGDLTALTQFTVDVVAHNLVLETRRTSFRLRRESGVKGIAADYPMLFEFFEDNDSFTRTYVRRDYLGACLHEMLLQHVRQVHSSRISYKSLTFTSFEKKEWSNNGMIARKNPLKGFDSIECGFNILTTGESPRDIVNVSANLLFTVTFDSDNNNFYRTNRYITCSCIQSPNDIKNPSYAGLWPELEAAFGADVKLADTPLIILKPAFERGPTIEVSNNLYFRGLVSNAGTSNNIP
jgi:hypothetical protein